ncbi:hypothetical protein N9954_06125 [Maribacter sp.]|nr:hypothetical protein [Maribacter sp.]
MKNHFVFVLFLFSFLGSAQSSKHVEAGLFKINALTPGVSYEFGVGKDFTLNLDALLGFALNGGSDRDTEFGLFPGIQADFRYFTNMERRLAKGKNISGNSGNYLAITNVLSSGESIVGDLDYSSNYFHNIAFLYGIQRTRPKGFYWGLSFGPGAFTDDFGTDFGLFIDGRIGWVISKRN